MIGHKQTWEDLEAKVKYLATQVPQGIEYILPIPRGGLIPAVMLSHQTGLQLTTKDRLYQIKGKYIVIDDICDSGKTLKKYLREGVYCAVLFSKKHHSHLIEAQHIGNTWIQFPWETNQSSKIDYLENGKN